MSCPRATTGSGAPDAEDGAWPPSTALAGDLRAAARAGIPFCSLAPPRGKPTAPPAGLSPIVDKYRLPRLPEIDCASRLALCGARCCKLTFRLSQQDIDEGVVRWNPERPYWNERRADKSCVHLDEGRCSIHAHRPGVCRLYDCRTDQRIWLDFDRRIPAP